MKIVKVSEIIKITARKLRKEMTESEKILWNKLKTKKMLGKKFLRQAPVYIKTENNGFNRFVIPDFICKSEKLILELDGSIHDLKNIYELDKQKEILLKNLGYKIIRFNNTEIKNNLNNSIKKIVASFSY